MVCLWIERVFFFQEILTNIAMLLGAERSQAERDMHAVIAFEIELAMVINDIKIIYETIMAI